MSENSDRYELIRVSAVEWVIRDRRHHSTDQRSTVARIWEVDANEYEVEWMRDLPLPMSYASAADALADLCAVRRHTKPVPIPHFPPVDTPADSSKRPMLDA